MPGRLAPGSLDAGDAPWTAEGKGRSPPLGRLCALSAPAEKRPVSACQHCIPFLFKRKRLHRSCPDDVSALLPAKKGRSYPPSERRGRPARGSTSPAGTGHRQMQPGVLTPWTGAPRPQRPPPEAGLSLSLAAPNPVLAPGDTRSPSAVQQLGPTRPFPLREGIVGPQDRRGLDATCAVASESA